MKSIRQFRGAYAFLSNMSEAPTCLDGIQYPTVENAFQAAKTTDPNKRRIFESVTAVEARRLGRNLPLRPDWETAKIGIMEELLYNKFSRSRALCERLLATGDMHIVEENPWGDTFWGVCKSSGLGENRLGLLLMRTRRRLRLESEA